MFLPQTATVRIGPWFIWVDVKEIFWWKKSGSGEDKEASLVVSPSSSLFVNSIDATALVVSHSLLGVHT